MKNATELTKALPQDEQKVILDNNQDHVSSEFWYNGQTYQANLVGLKDLFKAVKGQRNALKMALAWSLDRALICSQNSQKGPLVAALDAIAKEESALLKKAKAYVEAYAPYLVLTWQDKVSVKGVVTQDTKAAPLVTYVKWNELPNRRLSGKLDGLLQWKPAKVKSVKQVEPVTERQAGTLAERLSVSDAKAQEQVISKLLTSKNAASAALSALEGIKTMTLQDAFCDSEKTALLAAVESLAKHLQPKADDTDDADKDDADKDNSNVQASEVAAEKDKLEQEQKSAATTKPTTKRATTKRAATKRATTKRATSAA